MIYSSAMSNEGLMRTNNEDNFFLQGKMMPEKHSKGAFSHISKDTNCFIAAVFDGMGGECAGEKASFLAASELMKYHKQLTERPLGLESCLGILDEYVRSANRCVFQAAWRQKELEGMGTTFASICVCGNQAVSLNIGDSRVYLFRNGVLEKLSTDHTEAERLVRLGVISRDNARKRNERFALSRYFGISPEEGLMEASVSEVIDIENDDIFIVCSDGLTDMLSEEDMKSIISNHTLPEDICSALVEQAIKNGGRDNITVIVSRVEQETESTNGKIFRRKKSKLFFWR